jgi:hypothetical protein
MKTMWQYSALLIAIGGALVGTFFLGQQYGGERVVWLRVEGRDQFLTGGALERGRSAWISAANLHSYLAFFESDRLEDLPGRIEDSLWYSIPDLYEFITNSDATDREREGAKMVLRRVALYFYEHPREHVYPQDVNLSDEVVDAAEKSPLSNDPGSTEQKVFTELTEGVGRALSGFDEVIEDGLTMLSEADREIQVILDELIEQREFPGRERSWGEMTIHLPRLPGHSSGGSGHKSFDYRGEGFDLRIIPNRITLNEKDYGEVDDTSIIDFRVPGKVFVDGKERQPETYKQNKMLR